MPGRIAVEFVTHKLFQRTIIERGPVVGFQGIQGPPGSGSASAETYTASTAISSGRIVRAISNAVSYFDPTNDVAEPTGISKTAAAQGDVVEVILSGPVVIPGWGLTPGSVYYAGENGTLISDPSQATGRVQAIGVAEDANTLIINIQPAIIL